MLATSLKFHMGINMNGTDLIPEILSSPKIKTFAIFGATDEVIVLAKEKLETMAKNVVAYCDGYHDNSTYSRKLRYLELDVVLLSMGMPKQELISNIISKDKKINNRLIICAGGFLDFFSRVKPRAPKFIITYRLEWLFRLIKEPARMFERNLYNIKIILIIGLNTLKGNA